MRTHDLRGADGRPSAFEIDNVYVSRRRIVKILGKVDGVTDVRLCASFLSSDDIRVEFEYREINFVVWEPYGDSSRYWIGPSDEHRVVDIDPLVRAFRQYEPPLVVKIVGDLVTLNFKSIFETKGSE